MSKHETLQSEIHRLTLEVQALEAKQGSEKISVGNYLITRLIQMGVKVCLSQAKCPMDAYDHVSGYVEFLWRTR
jgi:hypothetical protein